MPDHAATKHPPLPPRVLRVGITGHRLNRLDPAVVPAIEAQILALVMLVRDEVQAASAFLRDDRPAVLRLVSALAEGADRIAAHAALRLGFEVEVVLPFPQAEYEADFETAESLAEFRDLMGKAHAVFTLQTNGNNRTLGYRAAGEVMVMQSDLVVALWDGEEPHGVGGTAEVVDRALMSSVPVLHIDSHDPHRVRFLDDNLHGNPETREARVALVAYLQSVLALGGPTVEEGGPGHPLLRRLRPAPDSAKVFAADYAQAVWPRRVASTAYVLLHLFTEGKLKFPQAPDPTDDGSIVNPVLRPYFAWTDALAVRFGELSRSASLRIQLWAAIAVISCVVAIVSQGVTVQAEKVLSTIELISTLAVTLEAYFAWRLRWHSRWMTFRALAEQIRCLDLLSALALSMPRPHGVHLDGNTSADDFSAHFMQAVTRAVGVPNATVDAEYLAAHNRRLLEAVDRQRHFHHVSGERYQRIEQTLTIAGSVIFFSAFAIAAYNFILAFGVNDIYAKPYWQKIGTVLLPVMGAVLAALAAQGEFKRLGHRSDGMRRALAALGQRLRRRPARSLREASAMTLDVSEVLVTEVREWQVLLSTRPPSMTQ